MLTMTAQCCDPSSAILYIPGILEGNRYVVIYRGTRYFVQRAPFNLLLQAIAARFATTGGYLYRLDILSFRLDPQVIGMTLHRLRKTIAADIIETHFKSLRLSVDRTDIAVDRAVFDLPPEIVDSRVLKYLRGGLEGCMDE